MILFRAPAYVTPIEHKAAKLRELNDDGDQMKNHRKGDTALNPLQRAKLTAKLAAARELVTALPDRESAYSAGVLDGADSAQAAKGNGSLQGLKHAARLLKQEIMREPLVDEKMHSYFLGLVDCIEDPGETAVRDFARQIGVIKHHVGR